MPKSKVVVVGAGPVGSLAALYAATRGNDVEVYELRSGRFKKSPVPQFISCTYHSHSLSDGCESRSP